ncbi:MAG TPA: hypothetical protein VHD56_12920 [Tepidisphaeraceae bacterium]|nr:hypothetical protein [Tepidisphaeraceae bacterium]
MPRLKVGLLVSLALVMFALLIVHAPYVNGPVSYWAWGWRRLDALFVYPCIVLAGIPFLAAQFLDLRRCRFRIAAIALLVISSWMIRVAGVMVRDDPPSMAPLPRLIGNPQATSYFTDAMTLSNISIREWMADYPQRMPNLNLHSQTKPPGPVIYWWVFIKLFGVTQKGAIIGGLTLGLFGALAIPATYLLLKHLLLDSVAAFCGASFLALSPGFVLFFPMFDSTYILLSCALIGFWSLALRDDRPVWSVMLGATLGLILVITYNILVIGVFMMAVALVTGDWSRSRRMERIAKHATIAAGTTISMLVILRFALGFHPIQTFTAAWTIQRRLLAEHPGERPWPQTIPFDLTDFALGSAWVSYLLAIYYFAGPKRQTVPNDQPPSQWMVAILAILQLVIVALTGLLPLETARVWNFLLPLLMIPIGLELQSWTRKERLIVYGAVLLITAAICQNLTFIGD